MVNYDVGDTVYCVDDSISPDKIQEISQDMPNWVTRDKKYIVRGFNDNNDIVVGVLLEEVKNPLKYFKLVNRMQEPAFATWRFKKSMSDVEEESEQLVKELLLTI